MSEFTPHTHTNSEGLTNEHVDNLSKAIDFANATGATSEYEGDIVPIGNGMGNALGFKVVELPETGPNSGNIAKEVIAYNSENNSDTTTSINTIVKNHVFEPSEDEVSGSKPVKVSQVNYETRLVKETDLEGNKSARSHKISIERHAVNGKTGKMEKGPVTEFTGNNKARAEELIASIAARQIANKAEDRALRKLDEFRDSVK